MESRHPHVVQGLDVLNLQDTARVGEDLLGADLDDPGGGQAERALAVQARDFTRPCHGRRLPRRLGSEALWGGAVGLAVEEVEHDPLAQAALADLQRLAEQL